MNIKEFIMNIYVRNGVITLMIIVLINMIGLSCITQDQEVIELLMKIGVKSEILDDHAIIVGTCVLLDIVVWSIGLTHAVMEDHRSRN